MKNRIHLLATSLIIGLGLARTSASVNAFLPSTNSWVLTPSTNNWVVDRYPPHSFGATNVGNALALQIGIDPADSLPNRPSAYQYSFYNTQGFQVPTGFGSNDWSVSGSLFVTPDLTNGGAPYRSDIWARTGTTNDESVAQYFIMGLIVGNTNVDETDPAPASTSVAWEVWDDYNGVWNYLSVPVTNGWNSIQIWSSNGVVNYSLNGSLVYTETNIEFGGYVQDLTTVFLEAYNFLNGSAYTATWGNDWVIDRAPPTSVTATNVGGVPAWNIGIDPSGYNPDTFYDYQGFQIPANTTNNNHWAAYASLYIPTNVANGTFAPYETGLWVDTADADGPEDYYIIDLFVGDPVNQGNPNPTSVTEVWRVFDDNSGDWINLSAPVTSGWHTVRISQDNGVVYYYIDTTLAYTETDIGVPDAIGNLNTIFLETANFDGPAYDATWANIGDTDDSTPFLTATLTITTVRVTAQPGFEQDLLSVTNIAPNEVWTPIAAATNVTGNLRYRLSSPLPAAQQFFRSVSSP